jgi:hypothetical protein
MAPLIGSHVHIPDEIFVHVVKQLDPITLITLSQTSQSWRALINPNRHDYNQRLLALELAPEYGGIVPLFDEDSQTLSPPCESPEWKLNKYACCGCMKLLSHMMFDNDAVLRPAYRKPPPGSVEANKTNLTDWEPMEPSLRWRRIQERVAVSEAEREKWLRAVQRKREWQPSSQPSPTPWGPRYQAGYDSQNQKYIIGNGRQKRRCIECQRQSGRLARVPSHPRHLHSSYHCWELTAVPSRHLKITSYFEWEFPSLIQWLPPDQVPTHCRTSDLPLTLYVIHCPSCKKWQESLAFRLPDLSIRGFRCEEELEDPLLCNDCHLETHQDPDFLAQKLSRRALAALQKIARSLEWNFIRGWRLIQQILKAGKTENPLDSRIIELWVTRS